MLAARPTDAQLSCTNANACDGFRGKADPAIAWTKGRRQLLLMLDGLPDGIAAASRFFEGRYRSSISPIDEERQAGNDKGNVDELVELGIAQAMKKAQANE